MSIVLSNRASKLLMLCRSRSVNSYEQLCALSGVEAGRCPGICMTEGCDLVADVSVEEGSGRCGAFGGKTVMSAVVLAKGRH